MAEASEEKLLKEVEEGSKRIFSCLLQESYSCPGLSFQQKQLFHSKTHVNFVCLNIPAVHFLKNSEERMSF